MSEESTREGDAAAAEGPPRKRLRADAQRSTDALLTAAAEVFATSGVDAPVREITAKAGVGPAPSTATSRNARTSSPRSSATKSTPAPTPHPPGGALRTRRSARQVAPALRRLHRHETRTQCGPALGDPAYDTLPSYFQQRFMPVLGALLDTAAKAGEIRSDVDPEDLLVATRNLTLPAQEDGNGHTPA